MTQYVIQIQTSGNGMYIGWLAKSFEVNAENPIPTEWAANRIQVIMTNTGSFDSIVAAYDQYRQTVFFSQNGSDIDASGAVTDSWPID